MAYDGGDSLEQIGKSESRHFKGTSLAEREFQLRRTMDMDVISIAS